jgi:hypothetical protein
LHYTVLGFPAVPYPRNLQGIGIADLARQVDLLESDYERQHGQKPFIVCMDSDRLAGWIAFYRAKMVRPGNESQVMEFVRNTTGGHLFLRNSHMYRFWHPIETYDKERPLLIIAVKHHYLLKDQVLARIRPLTEIEERFLQKHGKPTTPFFYQFAYIL